jgi:hypothetical protein
VAAVQLVLAPRVAWIVQVPTITSVTVDPDTEHTGAVCELKLTVAPEFDVAPTLGEVPKAAFGKDPKLMVCVPCLITRFALTGVAAAQLTLSPAWVA